MLPVYMGYVDEWAFRHEHKRPGTFWGQCKAAWLVLQEANTAPIKLYIKP